MGRSFAGRLPIAKSPIVYGYAGSELPVYFNQAPVLNAGGAGRGGAPAPQNPNAGLGQIVAPNAAPLNLSVFDGDQADAGSPAPAIERPKQEEVARLRQQAVAGSSPETSRPRVVMRFPDNPTELLLSGTIANGQYLSGRAVAVDEKIGQGHVVMFAIRPFWRWQTQGTYSLGFNAIMNWNDLDAGK